MGRLLPPWVSSRGASQRILTNFPGVKDTGVTAPGSHPTVAALLPEPATCKLHSDWKGTASLVLARVCTDTNYYMRPNRNMLTTLLPNWRFVIPF
jgi:hypothetical protein